MGKKTNTANPATKKVFSTMTKAVDFKNEVGKLIGTKKPAATKRDLVALLNVIKKEAIKNLENLAERYADINQSFEAIRIQITQVQNL